MASKSKEYEESSSDEDSTLHGSVSPETDNEILVNHWRSKDPWELKGLSNPGVVLYINQYVKEDYVYIPCEIGMVAFSVKEGIDDFYWTLVDPVDSVPKGFGIAAQNNAQEFGIPLPDFSAAYPDYEQATAGYRNYEKIVADIEKFLDKQKHQDANFTFIFASKKTLSGYNSAMKWLYGMAGKEFTHKIFPWEKFLVTLSLNGLGMAAETMLDGSLPDILDQFQKTLTICDNAKSEMRSEADTKSVVSASIKSFITAKSGGGDSDAYSKIGKKDRVASTYQDKYPFAMLGGFLFEGQAEQFMNIGEYLYIEELACSYHRENLEFQKKRRARTRRVRRNLQEDIEEDGPSDKITSCALLHAIRQVYLALDVILVNYSNVKPKRGRHYPWLSTDNSSTDSSSTVTGTTVKAAFR